MYTNWEYRTIQLDWDDNHGDYGAAIGPRDEIRYGVDEVLNEAGGHGWELVSFTSRRDGITRDVRVLSFIAIFKRPAPI